MLCSPLNTTAEVPLSKALKSWQRRRSCSVTIKMPQGCKVESGFTAQWCREMRGANKMSHAVVIEYIHELTVMGLQKLKQADLFSWRLFLFFFLFSLILGQTFVRVDVRGAVSALCAVTQQQWQLTFCFITDSQWRSQRWDRSVPALQVAYGLHLSKEPIGFFHWWSTQLNLRPGAWFSSSTKDTESGAGQVLCLGSGPLTSSTKTSVLSFRHLL